MTIVLDTCAVIWWSLDPEMLSPSAQSLCDVMEKEKSGLVASISVWEIALKVKRKKLNLGVDLETYINTLFRSDVIRIIPIDSNLWVESVNLNWEHRDPADRVIVALAKKCQAQLITKDEVIRRFYSRSVW